jgi:hypothetical protein
MMQATRTRWVELCAEAAICEDRERFQELIEVITAILQEEMRRLETPAVRTMRAAS